MSDVAKNADSVKMKNIESELAGLRNDVGKLTACLSQLLNLENSQPNATVGSGGKEYVF